MRDRYNGETVAAPAMQSETRVGSTDSAPELHPHSGGEVYYPLSAAALRRQEPTPLRTRSGSMVS